MPSFYELVCEKRNNPFGAAVQGRRHPLRERCNLCNVHVPVTYATDVLIRSQLENVRRLKDFRTEYRGGEAVMSVFTNPASAAAEHATAYIRAILDLLGARDPMAVLSETPSALARAIDGLSPQQLRRPEQPGKWSIVQILQHLADAELVSSWRIRLILAQDRPPLTGYDQDLWADRLQYSQSDPSHAMELFAALRRANLTLFRQASPSDLNRVGVHVERGEESVEHLRRLIAGHDLLHLQQTQRVRAVVS